MTSPQPEPHAPSAWEVARQGVDLHRAGRLDEAARHYRRALALSPTLAEVWSNLGAMKLVRSEASAAAEIVRRALRLDPGHPAALNNLGLALLRLGRLAEAQTVFEALLELRPDDVGALHNLGSVRQRQGDEAGALAEFEDAVALDPANLEARISLATGLRLGHALTRAIAHFRQALAQAPQAPELWADLGNTLALAGRHDEAREALVAPVDWSAGAPDNASVRLFTLNTLADVPAAEVARLHREAGQRLEATVPRMALPKPAPLAGRRLRVGYVSPDFRFHPVGRFLLPLIAMHDRGRVEVACYAELDRLDALGEIFRDRADLWRPTAGLSHEELAARIAADRIDVLVDVAGHTAHNRLPVFARKPAPVQATWLGYPNTTGLSRIDHRITDAIADPPGMAEALHTEGLVRLPGGFLCFGPPEPPPPVAPPPMRANGFVTFGSFNALSKVNPAVVVLWGRILASVPNARLLLKAPGLADAPSRRRLAAALHRAGAPPGSVHVHTGWIEHGEHLSLYGQIDIALDPFPYNGTTTTCEALFMGVPVITLAGDRHAGRVGATLLTRLGLDRLVARDEETYLAAARWLAANPAELALLRRELRPQFLRSPLCDARRFARQMEDVYHAMMEPVLIGVQA